MVLETLTTLRIVAGLVAVGATLYHGEDDKGESLYQKTPEAIFGQVIGGIFYDFFKLGASKAHETLVNKYKNINFDRDSLNHDLQKAARQAQLVATFFAAQDCLEKVKAANLPDTESGKVKQFFGKATEFIKGRDAREVYLASIIKFLDEAINNLDSADFSGSLTNEQFSTVFDTYQQGLNPKNKKDIADSFKQDIIRELKILEIVDSEIKRDAEAFKMLTDAINDGWNELPKENILSEKFVSLSIINLPQTELGERYDWFDLVAVIFNEEYKTNPRVEATAQKQLLIDISTKLDNFGTVNSDDYKKLTVNISAFANDLSEITTIVKRTEGIVKRSERKLDDIHDTLTEFVRGDKRNKEQNKWKQVLSQTYKCKYPQESDFEWVARLEEKYYSENNDNVSTDTLLKWFESNPFTFVIIKHRKDDKRVGYFDVLPLRPDVLQEFKKGEIDVADLKETSIFKASEKESVEDLYMDSIIIDLDDYSQPIALRYVLRHIPQFLEKICNVEKVKNVYAIAATDDGKAILEGLGFNEIMSGEHRKDNDPLYQANFQQLYKRLRKFIKKSK